MKAVGVTGKPGKAGLIYAVVVSRLSAPRRLKRARMSDLWKYQWELHGLLEITLHHSPPPTNNRCASHTKSPGLSVTEITGILRFSTNQITSTDLLAFTTCLWV